MILMQINLNKINFIYSKENDFESMRKLRALKPFSDEVCDFLNKLSKAIMMDRESKSYPDVITFGFFLRKSNIEKLKQDYLDILSSHIGRGLSFHIAPSNVPINFAYSLVVGLLSGNPCIVRTSSKDFAQTRIVARLIKQVIEKYDLNIGKYISIIGYERDTEITDYFSSICESRVIWGGDSTIKEIRKSNIPSRTVDIAFADRYSVGIIDAKSILKDDIKNLAQDFYNDTYLYDQNACSSPRLIVWIGKEDEVNKAKEKFWGSIHEFLLEKYNVEPVVAVNKLLASYRCSIELDNVKLEKAKDNLINRIKLSSLIEEIPDYRCAGGSFLEYDDINLDELSKIVNKKYQTISYYGINPTELREWVFENGLLGIDRIVPIGKTSDFSLIWDGYDLIRSLSRICTIC